MAAKEKPVKIFDKVYEIEKMRYNMNTIQIIVDEAESTLMIVCNNRDVLKYAQAFTISHLLNKDVMGKDIKDIEYLLAKIKGISGICFDRFIVKTESLRKTSDLIEALQHNIHASNLPIIINY